MGTREPNHVRLLSGVLLIAAVFLVGCDDVSQKRRGVITAHTAREIVHDVLGGLILSSGFARIGFSGRNEFENLRISVYTGRMSDGMLDADVVARPGKLNEAAGAVSFRCSHGGTVDTKVDATTPLLGRITLTFNDCDRQGPRDRSILSGLQTIEITESEVTDQSKFVIRWTSEYDQLTLAHRGEQWVVDGVAEYFRSWDAGDNTDRLLIRSVKLRYDGHVLTFLNTTYPELRDTDPSGEAPVAGRVTSSRYGNLVLSPKRGDQFLITSDRDKSSVLVGKVTPAGIDVQIDEDGDGRVDETLTLPLID